MTAVILQRNAHFCSTLGLSLVHGLCRCAFRHPPGEFDFEPFCKKRASGNAFNAMPLVKRGIPEYLNQETDNEADAVPLISGPTNRFLTGWRFPET